MIYPRGCGSGDFLFSAVVWLLSFVSKTLTKRHN
nr:MAG TPA: hypothetical protein [Caudoviricetes sp.]